MLKEVVHYYSDTEPTREEIEDLKDKSFFEKKVIFVEYYCEYKDTIVTLEFNNRQMNVRQTGTSNNYHQVIRTPDVSNEELIRLCRILRDRTGEGLMTCKAALLNNNLNLEASQKWLRDKGLAKV